MTSNSGRPTACASAMPVAARSHWFHERTRNSTSVVKMPPVACSSNHRSVARTSVSPSIGSPTSSLLLALPLFNGHKKPRQRLNRQHDDHVADHFGITETKTGGDDQRVAERIVRTDQPGDDGANTRDIDVRYGKRDRQLQQ